MRALLAVPAVPLWGAIVTHVVVRLARKQTECCYALILGVVHNNTCLGPCVLQDLLVPGHIAVYPLADI
jgi:hypothetical protein